MGYNNIVKMPTFKDILVFDVLNLNDLAIIF